MIKFKRIIVESPAVRHVAVHIDSHDYDREDDITLGGVTWTQAHARTFREIIDRAHDAARYLRLPPSATIVNVQYIRDEGQRDVNTIDPAVWVFVWEWFGYSADLS